MTEIKVFQNRDGAYLGFESSGHAGYADKGEDIVCAGISVLVINTVNTLGRYTTEKFAVKSDEEDGRITLQFEEPAGHDGELLLKSLILGLQEIQHAYGNDYLMLDFREV